MIQRLLPFLSLIILFVALSIASPHFLTQTNLSSVVRQTAVINIMALGMTMIIISGGIDLSVGSTVALTSVVGATLLLKSCSPVSAAVLTVGRTARYPKLPGGNLKLEVGRSVSNSRLR